MNNLAKILLRRGYFTIYFQNYGYKAIEIAPVKSTNTELTGIRTDMIPKMDKYDSNFWTYMIPTQDYLAPLASFPIKVNSGRYIEMTMPPMVMPRKAMRTGSIIASKSAMAESTSSS